MTTPAERARHAFHRLSQAEAATVAEILGARRPAASCCWLATVIALVWANSPVSDAYESLREFVVGAARHLLELDLEHWASEGLLAVFFLVAGLELKREFVVGDLSDRREAVAPGRRRGRRMVLPARALPAGQPRPGRKPGRLGRARCDRHRVRAGSAGAGRRPATDRAAGVPARRSRSSTTCWRSSSSRCSSPTELHLEALGRAVALLGLYALAPAPTRARLVAVRRRSDWRFGALVHEAGVHATVAGVALGLLTRVRPDPGEERPPPSASSIWSARCRRRSLRPGVRPAGGRAWCCRARRSTGLATSPVALGIGAGLVRRQGRSASPATHGSRRGSPAPS